jgi:hypothetical protein
VSPLFDFGDIHGMTFSETLDEYLDLMKAGPEEGTGYTDKHYYYRTEALRVHMNELAPLK